jgi:hypothetical protein
MTEKEHDDLINEVERLLTGVIVCAQHKLLDESGIDDDATGCLGSGSPSRRPAGAAAARIFPRRKTEIREGVSHASGNSTAGE